MPSPFPGMDPFIESQCWRDFHSSVIGEIRSALLPWLRPNYVAFVEEDVYIAREDWTPVRVVVPDVGISRQRDWTGSADAGALVAAEPTIVTLPMTDPIEIPWLAIRKRENDHMVAVIEVLSPTNKSPRDGRNEYLHKRNLLLRSQAHLIEIDLLRGGERLPTVEPHPSGDYFVFVSRSERRPSAEVIGWTVGQRMPTVPIPLADGDADVPLDLQSVFNGTYDRAGYDYALKYDRPVEPPLDEHRLSWLSQFLPRSR